MDIKNNTNKATIWDGNMQSQIRSEMRAVYLRSILRYAYLISDVVWDMRFWSQIRSEIKNFQIGSEIKFENLRSDLRLYAVISDLI